ncbi:hypothetical protein K1719_027475 [Acacia pycnantha]|nr:hypothetical protein K1719_027475 [Acacia pycnantha]
MSKIVTGTSAGGRWISIYIQEVHGEQRGMGYGLHLPRTSQVGNQVHQDDPVNEAVRDAFGVRDDNFTAKCGVRTVFFGNDAAREFFSLMDESDRPLYQGCHKYSKLSFRSNCTISSACVGSPIRQCRCSGITSRCIP